jgi:putative ABC transport system permease protein
VQIALALALLGAGGLLLRSLEAMLAQETGFAREGTLLASVEPRVSQDALYDFGGATDAEVAAVRGFYERIRTQAGLTVSFANAAPFSGSESVVTFLPPGKSVGEEAAAKYRSVGAGYFAALGIPIVAGREVDPRSAASEVVVDQVFAKRYLADGEPLGQKLGMQDGEDAPLVHSTVVGVARDVKHAALEERDEQGTFYVLNERPSGRGIEIVARTALPLADVRALLEREAAAAGLRVSRVATIDSLVWQTLRDRTALLGMIGAFALFGTALAVLGLYAALAFATRRRTAEFGLKRALGAPARRLARDVARDAWRIALPGFLLGVPTAVLALRAIESRLYGVTALDPATWIAVVAAVLLLVLFAAAIPARRAASVDPMRTLRQE